jgi:hypothetical protein
LNYEPEKNSVIILKFTDSIMTMIDRHGCSMYIESGRRGKERERKRGRILINCSVCTSTEATETPFSRAGIQISSPSLSLSSFPSFPSFPLFFPLFPSPRNLGAVSTFAGTTDGYQDGSYSSAQFNSPLGVYMNQSDKCLYVTDSSNNMIRKITMQGTILYIYI